MRDCNLNSDSFVTQLEHRIHLLIKDEIKVLRNHVVDNPNFLEEDRQLYVGRLNLKEFIVLGTVHWFFPKELQVMVNIELEQKLRHFSLEDQFLLKQFLKNKGLMINFLLETKLYHSRDFFGNYINETVKRTLKKIIFKRPQWFVARSQRKRGYHDHGSRTLNHIYIESKFVDLTREHNELEKKRQSHLDTLLFNWGWLE